MIRLGFALFALGMAASAEAGQEVPPPRPIRPVEVALLTAPPSYAAGPHAWRATPPVIEGRSSDRIVPVVSFGAPGVCGDEGWDDSEEDFADAFFDDDGDFGYGGNR